MAINFNSFTEGTTSNIQSNDYVVGFDNTSPGGERKWTVSTIANAVSGIMKTQLNNDISSSTSVTILSATLSASPIIAKAWVNFDGTNAFSPNPSTTAIRSSYNVSSITKNGNGNYTVNFTTPMSNTNYARTSWCSYTNSAGSATCTGTASDVKTINSCQFRTFRSSTDGALDVTEVGIAIFGN
jgi:hypothetical protein